MTIGHYSALSAGCTAHRCTKKPQDTIVSGTGASTLFPFNFMAPSRRDLVNGQSDFEVCCSCAQRAMCVIVPVLLFCLRFNTTHPGGTRAVFCCCCCGPAHAKVRKCVPLRVRFRPQLTTNVPGAARRQRWALVRTGNVTGVISFLFYRSRSRRTARGTHTRQMAY